MGLRTIKISYTLLETILDFPSEVKLIRLSDGGEDLSFRRSTAIVDIPWLEDVKEGEIIPEIDAIMIDGKETEFKET